MLEARGLSKHFGGVLALDGLDLAVAPNEILGLIGPNGSGKTTFFNVITGIYAADAGRVTFDGADVTNASGAGDLSGRHIAHIPALAPVAAALDLRQHHDRQPQAPQSGALVQSGQARRFQARVRAAVTRPRARWSKCSSPRLAGRMFEPVAGLPMIDRRRIEICRALISAPKLLLLDEPSAGMTHDETAELMNDILLVRKRNKDLTIIIVEHEMGVIERITDRCVVLNFGRKIAEGPYRAVAADAQVQEAYLGVA